MKKIILFDHTCLWPSIHTCSTPLESNDGSSLIKDYVGNTGSSTSQIFHNSSVIDKFVINILSQKDIIHDMMNHPTVVELTETIKEINTGKAAGFDCILIEILLHRGVKFTAEICHLISDV